MNKKIRKNYFFSLVYQVFTLITPLVTTPYVSRVLGSSGVGQYSFTYSIASYFVLFGSLGFSYYAQREIARFQDDIYSQTVVFWEVFFARLSSVCLSLIVYIILILSGLFGEYTSLMIIFTINIIAVAFDITYYFQGNENFSIIALRNIIIKCIGIALIFIFVKNENDVGIYTFSHSIILIVSNLSLWTKLRKNIVKVKFSKLKIKRHYLKTLRLFIPTIAVSVYTMLDKTLIGLLIPGTIENASGTIQNISDIENGFYEQSEKLVKMATTVVGVLGSVMLPRNSNAAEKGDYSYLKKNVYMAFRYIFFIGCPITFGLIAISHNLTPWFFGPGYEKVAELTIIFSPLAIILGVSNVIGIQYLLPIKEDSKYTFAICLGAFINVALNIILIPRYYSYGAAFATIIAELSVSTIMCLMVKDSFSIKKIIHMNYKYILSSIIMFVLIFILQSKLSTTFSSSILIVITGTVIYFNLLFLMHDEVILNYLKKIKNKLFYYKRR